MASRTRWEEVNVPNRCGRVTARWLVTRGASPLRTPAPSGTRKSRRKRRVHECPEGSGEAGAAEYERRALSRRAACLAAQAWSCVRWDIVAASRLDVGRVRPAISRRGSRVLGGRRTEHADSEIRKARAAIHAGMLPGRNHVSVWGGPGSGGSCAVCGSTVPGDGLGFELEFRDAMGRLELRYVHIPCFAAWDLECRSLLQADGNTCTISDRERVEP